MCFLLVCIDFGHVMTLLSKCKYRAPKSTDIRSNSSRVLIISSFSVGGTVFFSVVIRKEQYTK
jgi:hypothetical protein